VEYTGIGDVNLVLEFGKRNSPSTSQIKGNLRPSNTPLQKEAHVMIMLIHILCAKDV
jgi:hypothetical protein